jgi:exosome complex RNA-binding protein Rrp4
MIPAFDHFFIGDVQDMHNHQLKVDISKTTPKPSQFSNKFFLKRKIQRPKAAWKKLFQKS